MSRAQELKKARSDRGLEVDNRQNEPIENAESFEYYYQTILTDEKIEQAITEYEGNYEKISNEFLEKTRIQGTDLGFLFFAVMLQCARIYVINKITQVERANAKGGKEDLIHKAQEKVLGQFGTGDSPIANPLYASLDTIISTRGVPYDASSAVTDEIRKMRLFKGSNHRFSTLGHDPVLGLIFGTANILTNTITTNK